MPTVLHLLITVLHVYTPTLSHQGVLYHDRMKQSEVDKIRQGLLDLEEAFISANPGVKVQRLGAPKKAAAKGFGGAARR